MTIHTFILGVGIFYSPIDEFLGFVLESHSMLILKEVSLSQDMRVRACSVLSMCSHSYLILHDYIWNVSDSSRKGQTSHSIATSALLSSFSLISLN